ncbi:MAG: hypothetical protein ABI405_12685 [Parafilimonas sp.]
MGLFDKPTGGEHKGGLRQIFEAAKPELNLSADQEQKIKEIFKDLRDERHDLKDESGDNMQDDMRANRQQAKQKIMDILNADQQKIIHQHLNEWRNKTS